MDGSNRGRGRGRPTKAAGPPPDKAIMAELNQERESLANSSALTPEQVADAGGEEEASKLTTTGEGKTPPLAEDLKETIRTGVQVAASTAPTSNIALSAPNKLNPDAKTFRPMSTTTYLDPNSSVFSPSLTTAPSHSTPTTSTHPIYTKNAIPTTTSNTTASRLDPRVKEFVPGGGPSMTVNGDMALFGNGDVLEDEGSMGGYLDSKDIMQRFERAAPTETTDTTSKLVLQEAAEMLLKVYNYPGSFNEIGKTFQYTIDSKSPTDSTLINLAEMLVHWGATVPDLRYASSRLCHLISETSSVGEFKTHLVKRLQAWNKKANDTKLSTDADKYSFSNFAGFFAEIYAKITTISGEPLNFLGDIMFQHIEKLFGLRSDLYVREACNILKLTGSNLVTVENYSDKMAALLKTMNDLAVDKSLSKNCTALILQVVELSETKWRSAPAPIRPAPEPSPGGAGKKVGDAAAGLNTDAIPFVPSGPLDLMSYETVYDMPVTQQPVSCSSEWDEFVGEDQPVEGYDDSYGSPDAGEDEYDGLDPDIELEMEAFIDEIEEHLMLQDFDPELHQEPKS